MRGVKQEA